MIAIVASFGAVAVAALLAALGWMLREQISQGKTLVSIEAQYQNNGGSTIRDAVDRIENKLDEHLIVAAVDHHLLEDHLAGQK